jgi:hypothetical protein
MAFADMADRFIASHKTRRRGLIADVKRALNLALYGPAGAEAEWLAKLQREVLDIIRDSGALVTKDGKAVRKPTRKTKAHR